jgi:hypothetical protein
MTIHTFLTSVPCLNYDDIYQEKTPLNKEKKFSLYFSLCCSGCRRIEGRRPSGLEAEERESVLQVGDVQKRRQLFLRRQLCLRPRRV